MNAYQELQNIRKKLAEIAVHPDMDSASVECAIEQIDEAIDSYEQYAGIGEYEPTWKQERDRQMQDWRA